LWHMSRRMTRHGETRYNFRASHDRYLGACTGCVLDSRENVMALAHAKTGIYGYDTWTIEPLGGTNKSYDTTQLPTATTVSGSKVLAKNGTRINDAFDKIDLNGNQLYLNNSESVRPDATGYIDESVYPQTGSVNFPDDRTYQLYYYPDEATIYWDRPRGQTSNIWRGKHAGDSPVCTASGDDCVFPFEYAGRTYDGVCVADFFLGDWCWTNKEHTAYSPCQPC